MGIVQIDETRNSVNIYSHIVTYGEAATEDVTLYIRHEIESMWNEPLTKISLEGKNYTFNFRITAELNKNVSELEVLQNTDPANNYFRIEEFASGNISFVDGLGCNTGYFKLENLYEGSTTAAHEYGHTIGLPHPDELDIRNQGVPGIMYPRGTLVDAQYQYEVDAPAGMKGGTMHPKFRKVRPEDILDLKLHKLNYKNREAILGGFSSVYHWRHS